MGSVSNYINNHGNLKSATKKKIEAAIDKLEYEPDFFGPQHREREKPIPSQFIVPDITNPFFCRDL